MENTQQLTDKNVFDQIVDWLVKLSTSDLDEPDRVDRALRGMRRLSKRFGCNVSTIWQPESFNQTDRSVVQAAWDFHNTLLRRGSSLAYELPDPIVEYMSGITRRRNVT
jgi:hypothetical protein